MDLNEYKGIVQKRSVRKTARVRNSWGVYDAYKHIRKNSWYNIGKPVKEHDFYTIIREVNKYLAAEIVAGNTVKFPERMGKLELRKFEAGVKITDGKLKITYPIDWDETIRLWYEDEEARKNKTLLRNENKYVYRVRYCKGDANYNNKAFYEFALNRFIKRALKDSIVSKGIDTLYEMN